MTSLFVRPRKARVRRAISLQRQRRMNPKVCNALVAVSPLLREAPKARGSGTDPESLYCRCRAEKVAKTLARPSSKEKTKQRTFFEDISRGDKRRAHYALETRRVDPTSSARTIFQSVQAATCTYTFNQSWRPISGPYRRRNEDSS